MLNEYGVKEQIKKVKMIALALFDIEIDEQYFTVGSDIIESLLSFSIPPTILLLFQSIFNYPQI
jgi:hypothetical protein